MIRNDFSKKLNGTRRIGLVWRTWRGANWPIFCSRSKKGQFDVNLERRKLDAVTNRLVLGVLTAAIFVGSARVLSSSVPPLIQGDSVLGALGCLISLSMGFRLVRAIRRLGNIESN